MGVTQLTSSSVMVVVRRDFHWRQLLVPPSLVGLLFAGFVMNGCTATRPSDGLATSSASSPTNPPKPVVAVVIFEGVELLDFAGPAEVFAACRDNDDARIYDIRTVGVSTETLTSMHAFRLTPQYDPGSAPDASIIVVPGGNVISTMADDRMMSWLRRQADRGAIMFSVCNGASIVAKVGLLEERTATTHHENLEILQLLDPSIQVRDDRRFVDHGSVLTAGGVSAGIDAALYLIERLHGADIARRSAVNMEYEHWTGFHPDTAALDRAADGSISRPGRVYERHGWAVMELLVLIRDRGVDAALADYPALLAATNGHDREMIEESGLDEAAWWLLTNARDTRVPLEVMRFIAAAYPASDRAQHRLREATKYVRQQEARREQEQQASTISDG